MAAESHLVADQVTGHVLAAKNENTPRQVASLTKIATAVVILEWLSANDIDPRLLVPVPPGALSGGANPLGLKAGDMLPLDSGLYAAMMASDNTSAYAMAAYIGGKMQAGASATGAVGVFVGKMNELAKRLGMDRTLFVNPHGLDESKSPGFSTAADIARLAIHAYDRPDFSGFCRERERKVDFFRNGKIVEVTLLNTNELTGSRGIDGTKTGTTLRSGPCLVASGTKEIVIGGEAKERRLVSVVLNAEDRFRETVLLFNEAWPACEAWLAGGGETDPKQYLRNGPK